MAIDINIPSQVKTYANLAAFPATGSLKTIFIAEDTNKTYRWTGTAYVEVSAAGATGITIGTTAITSGTVGRVLFEGTGNVVQESANLFWDNTNGRLGIGTSSPSAIIHSVGSVTASGAIARSNYLNNTLVASANSDILVGLDIQPTFTNGAFTGVDNFSLRINGGKGVIGTTANTGVFPLIVRQSNYSGLLVQNSFTGTNHNSSYDGFAFWTNNDGAFAKSLITNWDNNGIYIYNSGISPTGLVLFGATNNLGLNTTTDAGYKLDVNGTARVQGKLTVSTGGLDLTGTLTNFSGYQGYGQMQLFSGNAFQMFNSANNSKISLQYTTATGLSLSINPENLSGVNTGLALGASLVASANNQTLVGLDINPTFNTGAFTGVETLALRVTGFISNFTSSGATQLRIIGPSGSNKSLFFFNSSTTFASTRIYNAGTTNHLVFATGDSLSNPTDRLTIFASTGNIGINTTTDAGYKLDVNGTARLNTLTIGLGGGGVATSTALGFEALNANTTGASTLAVGYQALKANTAGQNNVALGSQALTANTTGNNNIAIGRNTSNANTTGSQNIVIGGFSGTGNFSNTTILGYNDTATADNQMRFGSATNNNGAVTTEVNASTQVWNVIINGVARKILLA